MLFIIYRMFALFCYLVASSVPISIKVIFTEMNPSWIRYFETKPSAQLCPTYDSQFIAWKFGWACYFYAIRRTGALFIHFAFYLFCSVLYSQMNSKLKRNSWRLSPFFAIEIYFMKQRCFLNSYDTANLIRYEKDSWHSTATGHQHIDFIWSWLSNYENKNSSKD